MTQDATESPASESGTPRANRHEDLVELGMWVGLILALVAVISGVTWAVEGCPGGDCRPQAGLGIAIAALSVVLGILLVFAGIVARATLRARSHVS
jgi:hypothetical protein